MDAFDIVAGSIGIASAVFALWVWLDGRKKEAVERQKFEGAEQRLADIMSIANGVAKQAILIVNLADRDDVSKKELKHLAVAQNYAIESLQGAIRRTAESSRAWKFGQPATYLPSTKKTTVSSNASGSGQAAGGSQP